MSKVQNFHHNPFHMCRTVSC